MAGERKIILKINNHKYVTKFLKMSFTYIYNMIQRIPYQREKIITYIKTDWLLIKSKAKFQ